MQYVVVDIMHIGKANWRAYIPLLDDFVDATSEYRVRYERISGSLRGVPADRRGAGPEVLRHHLARGIDLNTEETHD